MTIARDESGYCATLCPTQTVSRGPVLVLPRIGQDQAHLVADCRAQEHGFRLVTECLDDLAQDRGGRLSVADVARDSVTSDSAPYLVVPRLAFGTNP